MTSICTYRVSYGCGFAGTNGSGFLTVVIFERTPMQESLTLMRELMRDIRSETVTMNQELMRRVFEDFVNRTKIMSCKRSRPFSRN
jgi:hypothetical protein